MQEIFLVSDSNQFNNYQKNSVAPNLIDPFNKQNKTDKTKVNIYAALDGHFDKTSHMVYGNSQIQEYHHLKLMEQIAIPIHIIMLSLCMVTCAMLVKI